MKKLAFLFFLLTTAAQAQWQVPQYSIPYGLGPGKVGFGKASPGNSGLCLMSNGASAAPTFQTCPGAGTGGSVTQVTCGNGLSGGVFNVSGTCAVNYGTGANTAAQGNDSRILGALQAASNLSDLGNAATARANLGVSNASNLTSGTIPDARLSNVISSGSAGDATHIPVITYDAHGRIVGITTALVSGSTQWTTVGSNIRFTGGAVGVGASPIGWDTTYNLIQFGSNAAFAGINSGTSSIWSDNYYYDGANEKYIANGFATVGLSGGSATGDFKWFTAPSGTAGNAVTVTQRMKLSNLGALTLGAYSAGTINFDTSGNLISDTTSIYAADYSVAPAAHPICTNDPLSNDEVSIQAAITAANVNGGKVKANGKCYLNAALTFTKGITFEGIGQGVTCCGSASQDQATVLIAGFATGDVISATGLAGFTFRNFQVASAVGQRSSGAGIHISGVVGGPANNQNSIVENVTFDQQFHGLRFTLPGDPQVTNTHHYRITTGGVGILCDNNNSGSLIDHEASCGHLLKNEIYDPGNTAAALIETHVGYTNVLFNNLIGGEIAVWGNYNTTASGTTRLIGNLVENQKFKGFYFQNGNSKTASMFQILANEFSTSNATMTGEIEFVAGAANWCDDVQISTNIIRSQITSGSGSMIPVAACSNVQIIGQTIYYSPLGGSSNIPGIGTGGNITAPVLVSNNTFVGTNSAANYSLSTNTTLFDQFGFTVANLPAVADNSQTIATNGQATNIPASNFTVTSCGACVSPVLVVRSAGAWLVGGIR